MNQLSKSAKLIMFGIVFLLISAPVSYGYNHVALTQSDLPYAAQSNDSITFIGDTLYVANGTAHFVDNHYEYYNVLLIDGKLNVFVDFDNTVIFINTAGNSSSYIEVGMVITGSISQPSDGIIVQGPGKMIRDIGPGSESGSDHIGLTIFIARNVTINNLDITIDGMDSKCVYHRRVYNNIIFKGGHWRNNSNSFSDRQYFEAVAYQGGRQQETPGPGEFGVIFDGITVETTPHAGLFIGDCKAKVVNCTLSVDAQNIVYDTLSCFPGSCGVGRSAANAYAIIFDKTKAGSIIKNNVITSGSQFQGGRGILIQNTVGTASEPIIIDSNYVEVFNGPDGENSGGAVRVLRLRSLDGGHWDYVEITNNKFVGIVDTDPNTTAVGASSSVLQFSSFDTEVGWGNLLIEGNTVISRALTTGTDARAAEFHVDNGWRNEGDTPITIRNNHFISSGAIIRTADIYNAGSANYLTFEGDTLSFIDTNTDSGVIDNPLTWYIGYYYMPSDDIVGRDCVYLNGASDTNIYLYPQNTHEFALEKTLEIAPVGDNGLWINGATVTVTNAYGQTVLSGTTSNGELTGVVSYWYEQSGGSDSLNFNPFSITVSKDGVNNNISETVAWDNGTFAVPLVGLNGTVTPNQDPLSNLNNFSSTILAVDFSGENDSIQIGFTSGSDSSPDSAILTFSTGAFPDSSNSGRVSLVYSPSINYNFPIVASVNEPDTLYFSYWTRTDAGFWSDRRTSKLYIGDYTPPAAIDSSYAVPGIQDGQINFVWKATGDDGSIGSANTVQIKYSLSPINSSNWDQAQLFANPPTPLSSGLFDSVTISNLQIGELYYVAIKAIDDESNESPIASTSGYPRGILTPDNSVDTLLTDTLNLTATVFVQTSTSYTSLFYEFELDSDSNYSNPQKFTQTTFDSYASATFTNLTADLLYFWRSRAIASDSSEFSDWTLSRAFTLTSGFVNLGPSTPILLSPAQDDSLTSTTPTFIWSNSVDPDNDVLTYQIEVYDSTAATLVESASGITEGNIGQSNWAINSGLLVGGNSYNWRVRSFDGALYSQWTTFNFVTIVTLTTSIGEETFEIIAYPNPASKRKKGFVTFSLPSEPITLVIQSVSGETVIYEENLTNEFIWDLKNSSGKKVATGIYLWYVSSVNSSGKIMVKP